MSKLSDWRLMWAMVRTVVRAVALALSLVASAYAAQAVPARVEAFTAHTWSQFQHNLARPAVVIFSTTDCVYCPSVIDSVAREIDKRKAGIALIVVVMDGEGKPELIHDPEYRQASRLFAFAGDSAALQYGINPKWRGVTPYVALFAPQGAPKLMAGRPTAQDLDLLLAPAAGGR